MLKTFHVQTLPDLRQGSVPQTFMSLEFHTRLNSTRYIRNKPQNIIYLHSICECNVNPVTLNEGNNPSIIVLKT
jgi:hypothetical protein